MEKAYDPKDLLARLKAKGLDDAEKVLRDVFECVEGWVTESAKLSPNVYDDMAVATAVPKLKELVFAQIDKIDGEVG